jgi:lipopolysaccharide biosynthesis protein
VTGQSSPRARVIAFYLPQFHPIPENDAWWGKGFTEWTNVAQAKPLFPGHRQPRVPSELGFYDLRVHETRTQQSALAREHGVEGFCYWHYWFEGRRLLERPFMEVLESGEPEFPFCLGWANQSWTGVWHGAPDRVLVHQTYGGELDARRHFEAVLPAFRDPRYLLVDGCPIFVIYMPHEMPQLQLFVAAWRDWARAAGLHGIFFVGVNDIGWSATNHGLDGTIIANPWRVMQGRKRSIVDRVTRRLPFGNDITLLAWRCLGWPACIPYRDVVRFAVPQLGASEFPTVLPNWDNTPRSGRAGVVFTGSTPRQFKKHLEGALEQVRSRSFDRRLIFLKSWNEWAEGNYVEPDIEYGRGYLEAIRDVQFALLAEPGASEGHTPQPTEAELSTVVS